MSGGRFLLAFALAGGFAFAAGAPSALAADPIVPRPTTGGSYAYATPEVAPYVGARAVVHYVTAGVDAPPLNDDDGSGVPDYVEQVSAAADTALTYYRSKGFKAPLADAAGPDTKPDIYIEALPPGAFGLTFAQKSAAGGTFVLVSPRLDPGRPKAFGSLSVTVAHELAHVVQFSYVGDGSFPAWAAEGSAVALSMLVFPQVEDVVATQYLDAWLAQPWLPLYDERFSCTHCYGGAWWWLYLSHLDRGVLQRYFAQLEADDQAGKATRVGVKQLDAALHRSHAGSLHDVFTSFSVSLYRRGLPLGAPYSLSASAKPRVTPVRGVFGLSAQYVPVHVPAKSRGVVVAVPYGGGPRPVATLVVGGPKGRRITGKWIRPGRGVILSTLFRNERERKRIVLILTSGNFDGVRYQLGYASVRPGGRLPGWIAF
jgi:hypothetical protein